MDSIPVGLLDGIGVTGVLGLLFWMLSTGRLVVGRVLEDAIAQRAAAELRVAAAEERARSADERAAEARQVAMQATAALQDIAKRDDLGVALLKSIERQSGETGETK